MAHVVAIAQWALATLFAVATVSKLSRISFVEFVNSTAALLPHRLTAWSKPAAVGVVIAEAATVVALLVPMSSTWGFVSATALGGLFGFAVVGAIRRGNRAPCRCFGRSTTPLGPVHLARNLITTAIAVTALGVITLSPANPLSWLEVALCAFAGVVCGMLLIRLDDLAELFAPTSELSLSERQNGS
jgi:hypothetical protein